MRSCGLALVRRDQAETAMESLGFAVTLSLKIANKRTMVHCLSNKVSVELWETTTICTVHSMKVAPRMAVRSHPYVRGAHVRSVMYRHQPRISHVGTGLILVF